MVNMDELPNGVFVNLDATVGDAWLIWGDEVLAWSPGGYTERRPRPRGEAVTVLGQYRDRPWLRSGRVMCPKFIPRRGSRESVKVTI